MRSSSRDWGCGVRRCFINVHFRFGVIRLGTKQLLKKASLLLGGRRWQRSCLDNGWSIDFSGDS